MLPDTFYQDGAERKKSAGGGTRTVLQSRPAGLGRCAAVPVGGAVKTTKNQQSSPKRSSRFCITLHPQSGAKSQNKLPGVAAGSGVASGVGR